MNLILYACYYNPLFHNPQLIDLWRTKELQQVFIDSVGDYYYGNESDPSGGFYLVYIEGIKRPVAITGYWMIDETKAGLRWTAIDHSIAPDLHLPELMHKLWQHLPFHVQELFECANTQKVLEVFCKDDLFKPEHRPEVIKQVIASNGGDAGVLVMRRPESKKT